MKKLTLLGLVVALAPVFVQAAAEPAKPGFFSRNWEKAKDGVASAKDKYVNSNVRAAQWTADKLGLKMAERMPFAGPAAADEEGNVFEGPVNADQSSIQAHPNIATAVVTSAALAAVYGLYKLGQVTGVNAKIAQAKDAVLAKLGLGETKEAKIAKLKDSIATYNAFRNQKNVSHEDRMNATIQISLLEVELKAAQAA